MLCNEICPRVIDCKPLSNIVYESSFVCVGLHNGDIKDEFSQDIYRHCFKSEDSDSMHDYDEYDLMSVINVMSEALLINKHLFFI